MPALKNNPAKFEPDHLFNSIPGSRLLSSVGPAILLLIILTIAIGSEMFSGNVIGSTHPDNDLGYFLALRNFTFYADSSLPLWNPYVMCGVPLVAEIQSGIFYPPNLVFHFLPLGIAVNITLFLHLYLLALSTYLFGRQLSISRPGAVIAAAVFCFCSPVFLRLFAGHHTDLYTIAWIPAVFLIVHRIGQSAELKRFIYLGLILCLQFLAGHPQYQLYTIFFSWLYLLFITRHLLRRDKIKSWVLNNAGFFLSICIAGLIALPQIVPVFEMLSLSPRKTLDVGDVAWFSLPFQNLLTLLTPRIFGDGVTLPYWGLYNLWEMCAYCGTIALLFAVAAVSNLRKSSHVIYFIFLALFALVMALGDNTPLLKVLYYVLPGFKMFRGHSKGILFVCFAIAVLAGTGYDAIRDSALEKGRRFLVPLMVGSGILFMSLMVIPYPALLKDPVRSFLSYVQQDPRSYLPVPGVENTEFVNAAVKQAVMSVRYFLASFFIGIILILLTLRLGSRPLLNILTILFILGDVFFFGKTFVSSVDVHHWDLKPDVMQFLARDNDRYRAAVLTTFGPKYGITSNLHQIVGDYPYVLSRYSRLFNLANQGRPTETMKITAIRRISPVYNLLSLKYLVVNANRKLDIPGYYEVYNDGILSILENRYAQKRAYFPRSIKVVDTETEALRGVFDVPSIRGDQTIIEKEPAAGVSVDNVSLAFSKDPDQAVEIFDYSANRIGLRANLTANAWIILTDTFYPGWKATIDGKTRANILVANYIFRAIHVPKGRHEIVFEYWPTYFSVSITVALMTLLGCCLLAIIARGHPARLEN